MIRIYNFFFIFEIFQYFACYLIWIFIKSIFNQIPYFIHEHDEIPKRMIVDNQQVNSLSQCDTCHKDAIKGDFNEDRVVIPGFGPWDD